VGEQLRYRYFPVRLEELRAKIEYISLKEGSIDLGGGLSVTTKYLNHPILVLGYRFEFEGKVFCTAYDHEPYRNFFDVSPRTPATTPRQSKRENWRTGGERKGSKVLLKGRSARTRHAVHERGILCGQDRWGHSYFGWAIGEAHKAHVKHLVLFHHEPLRTDRELEGLHKKYAAAIRGKTDMKLSLARRARR